jgi:hypothetical protein
MSRAFHRFAGLAIVVGLLATLAPASSSAVTAPYRGTLTYGRQTAHINCTGSPAVPASITYTVPYDATHWNTSAPMTVWALFGVEDPGPTDGPPVQSAPVQETIQAGVAMTITATVVVPQTATNLPYVTIGLGVAGQMVGPHTSFPMTCAHPEAPSFRLPVVGTISHPCLGLTTARVTNGSSLSWSVAPVVGSPSTIQSSAYVTIPAGGSRTITVGRALHGAEHFYLNAVAINGTPPHPTLTDVGAPLILYSKACVPGHPVTTFTAVHSSSRDVLTVTIKPAIPGGAPVSFYRLVSGNRILVGKGTTGPRGIASISIQHHPGTYLAVVGPTHYSLRTTTVSRYVS